MNFPDNPREANMSVGKLKTRGGKGGNRHKQAFMRSTRTEAAKLMPSVSVTARVQDEAKYFECFDLTEKFNPSSNEIESSFVEDKSVTAKSFLRVIGQTLLRRGRPGQSMPVLKRQTSRGAKVTRIDADTSLPNAPKDRVLGLKLDL